VSQALKLYGIRNCDSMKKARAWLDAQGIAYQFHDYKTQGLDEALLRTWIEALGWEALINRRGQTWRKLDPAVRDGMDEAQAIQVMLDNPSIIRRPVLDTGEQRHLGFSEADYAALLS
jgi:Spx/MgsR family transcriptional regulator